VILENLGFTCCRHDPLHCWVSVNRLIVKKSAGELISCHMLLYMCIPLYRISKAEIIVKDERRLIPNVCVKSANIIAFQCTRCNSSCCIKVAFCLKSWVQCAMFQSIETKWQHGVVTFLSASLYVSKRGAYWDRLCWSLVGWSLVVCCHARALWPNGAS